MPIPPIDPAGKTVVIVHGYMGRPDAHWYPWLATHLRTRGATVHIPTMPDPANPVPAAWYDTLRATAPEPDGNTILIGHSLGCITILQALGRAPRPTALAGLILVAGFDQPLPELHPLAGFVTSPPDYDALRHLTPNRISILSDNDPVVPPDASRALARSLQARTLEIPGAGHFLDREGYTELPELLGLLRAA